MSVIRRLEASERKANLEPKSGFEDLDIVGIKPGPQPLPDQWYWSGNRDRQGGIGITLALEVPNIGCFSI
jgi:hypothetical protein